VRPCHIYEVSPRENRVFNRRSTPQSIRSIRRSVSRPVLQSIIIAVSESRLYCLRRITIGR